MSDPRWQRPKRCLNFSWVDEFVAGSARPGLDSQLRYLKKHGAGALIGAWEHNLGPKKKKVNRCGLEFLRLAVEDWTAPTIDQLDQALNFIAEQSQKSVPTVVACGYGEGRTGVFLTCYLLSQGSSLDDALNRMLDLQRIPYENGEQLARVREFAQKMG